MAEKKLGLMDTHIQHEPHQKIHPMDPEAPPPPTVPLVPQDLTRSEKGDPVEQHPPPVPRQIFPIVYSEPPRKKRSCSCCRCLCWTISLLILLVIIIAATIGILYIVFQPKIPSYSIDHLRITQFMINTDMSLSAKFIIRLTARNPNKKIGIYYEDGSNISAWYTSTKLCEGSLPKFYQGHKNTTVLDVELTGQIPDGNTVVQALSQQQQTGSIPLILNAKVPVRMKLGRLKLMKVKPNVMCNLVVDSLTQNNFISIKTSSCKLKFKL
ncbi:NDR1/HIN1-like protein 6 [Macadamia integrifolia]|uniref:NDR1/HIN1-like protein 6 n=1 Tax=Macadamia integrifolia TaxID=60698 RepID=UPI001C500FC6|nr:NDR1/HIN1-like protein 6 [Macadamia integrifolia]